MEFKASLDIGIDTLFSKSGSQSLGTLALNRCQSSLFLSSFDSGVGSSLIGFTLLDPFRKSQESGSIRAEDPEIVGARAGIEPNSKTRTHEVRHLRDFFEMVSAASPSVQSSTIRVIDIVFLNAVLLVELKLADHFPETIAGREDLKNDLRRHALFFPLLDSRPRPFRS